MIRKTVVAVALAVSLAALVAALLARPSGAAHRTYTFAYVRPYLPALVTGGREAAKRLGVRYIVTGHNGISDQELIQVYRSVIARHADAIATNGYDPALKPIFRQIRKAGILLISSGDDIAGARDLWVSQSDPAAYGRALADALASQIHDKGEYAILRERGQYPIADRWEKVVAAYIPKAYPNMKLDGVITETGAGDEAEVDSVKSFMAAHPKLNGLIGIAPTEAYMAAEAITQAGRIGQIFSAGNGGGDLKGTPLPGWVRSGAAEVVFAGNPITLGYLTVWAANYLLTGHHFRAGAYHVGGPIGLVWYYAKHRELRTGPPLTVTKANVALYAKEF
jgi:rhamnose transport system substrate-binding protein